MQTMDVKLSVSIPDHLVLVEKVELEQLQQEKLHGVYWNMKDLEKRTGRKVDWLKENILYHPRFREELDQFVYYPEKKGQTWAFHATKMADFLDKHFYQIFKPE